MKGQQDFWHKLPRSQARQKVTGQGQSPPPNCPHFRHQPQIPRSPGLPHFWPTGYKLGFPLRFSNMVEQHTELRKALFLGLPLYYSKRIQIRTNKRETNTAMSGRAPNAKLPLSSPCGIRICHSPSTLVCGSIEYCPPRKLTWASMSMGFIWTSLYRHDWLSHWPCDSMSSPPPLSGGWSDIKVAQSPNLLITWLVFLPLPTLILIFSLA